MQPTEYARVLEKCTTRFQTKKAIVVEIGDETERYI